MDGEPEPVVFFSALITEIQLPNDAPRLAEFKAKVEDGAYEPTAQDGYEVVTHRVGSATFSGVRTLMRHRNHSIFSQCLFVADCFYRSMAFAAEAVCDSAAQFVDSVRPR